MVETREKPEEWSGPERPQTSKRDHRAQQMLSATDAKRLRRSRSGK